MQWNKMCDWQGLDTDMQQYSSQTDRASSQHHSTTSSARATYVLKNTRLLLLLALLPQCLFHKNPG